ncbi:MULTISPECIES: tripartite tricarboxylate transporter substrate binding protein [unclassified Beijerinckia]|uniref:Bug family tripartite tricarboxylate transporter substrate binding protein n=1 Tax=unclassified Beijerinckia TaxID=2638183 RepID=UPI000899DABE|nr:MULTISPECIES: tripartite tricarboxylate transporter substrate binding protein [unclassified Beijerinckia]MDH7797630.1 tripartite-type tricarboxylate transporter receptor subunit TctC [Beijerinckia sp. GAS462]SEC92941.1 Tripartite-type tricarboxylate transporter, receptor component TctC [Beijerinckia sp. 28-YEA-48]
MLVGAGSAVLAVSGGVTGARAQQFPSQDFKVVCAFPPGSGADVLVRYFAEELRKKSGRTTIVENRVGAAGNIAAEYTVRAKPDGYTMFIHAGSSTAANYHLFKKPSINPAKDLQVAATLNQQPFMVVVAVDSPYKTLRDLTAAMLQKGDKASYAQSNTTGKVMGELYKTATGIKALEIPYRTTADSLNDFASGVVDYGMMDPQSSVANASAGRWRMLAVSTEKRMQAVPDLPTMTEEGVPGVELFGWFATMVPVATPRPVVDQLNTWFKEIVATPETKKFLNTYGGDPWITTPEEGQAQLVKDQAAWEGYVKSAKIEPQ